MQNMMAARKAALFILAVVGVAMDQAQATEAHGTSHGSASLRGSQHQGKKVQDAVPSVSSIVETLKSLDTDGDGKVGHAEIEVFARSQGLSAEEVRADFQDLDRNGDGELEASEIDADFAETESSSAPPAAAATSMEQQKTVPISVKRGQVLAAQPVEKPATSVLESIMPEKVHKSFAFDAATDKRSSNDLNLRNMQNDAEHQAGSVLAEEFARRAGQMFQQGMLDEQKAKSLDKLAKELHRNVILAVRSANIDTKQAARKAIADVADKAIAEVHRLKSESEQTEHAALLRRGRADEAMKRVLKLQAAMSASSRFLSEEGA